MSAEIENPFFTAAGLAGAVGVPSVGTGFRFDVLEVAGAGGFRVTGVLAERGARGRTEVEAAGGTAVLLSGRVGGVSVPEMEGRESPNKVSYEGGRGCRMAAVGCCCLASSWAFSPSGS